MTKVFVRRQGTATGGTVIVLHSGKNLQTGEQKFKKYFKGLTSLESDLLLTAAAVFASDRCIRRGEREDFNRRIELSIPVVNAVRLVPYAGDIEDVLRTLSYDFWRIRFREEAGTPEASFPNQSRPGKTLLFSGGLDSLAAALEFGGDPGGLQLVSHITHNTQTSRVQDQLILMMDSIGLKFDRKKFLVSATSTYPARHLRFDAENTQRTRSFMFLILGSLVARRIGHREVLLIAENGQMAIQLPLNPARAGAFSTHTAHPEVLTKMEALLQGLLQIPLGISNPYQDKTKAEVMKVISQKLPAAIPIASSCWRSARLPSGATHCGSCIPCTIRRIAVETHGVDSTPYARNLFAEPIRDLAPDDNGRRNLYDFVEFALKIQQLSPAEIMGEWPELHTVSNPVNTIQMYKRAAVLARNVLTRYAGVAPLFQ